MSIPAFFLCYCRNIFEVAGLSLTSIEFFGDFSFSDIKFYKIVKKQEVYKSSRDLISRWQY